MKDKDIHRLIQAQNKKENDALFERIQSNLGISSPAQASTKTTRKFNYKIFTLATAMVVVLCLAVVLPIVLQSSDDNYRFCTTGDLLWEGLDCSWKEYVLNNDISALYVDFDGIDERILWRGFEPDDYDNTVYFSEYITCYEAEHIYEYDIVPSNVVIDDIDSYVVYFYELTVNDITVHYVADSTYAAKFEYQGYKYYFKFMDPVDEQFIRQTIESMFH